jgi:chromosome partitioning protein
MSSLHGSSTLKDFSEKLSRSLQNHSESLYPPNAKKTLRVFSMRETCDFVGVNLNTFRRYIKLYEGKMPTGDLVNGNRRYFRAEEIQAIREFLWKEGKITINEYRRRQPGEEMKVISVFNLKGGVGKTLSTVTIAEHMALLGYRVLVIDLDAQASTTNMLDIKPEIEPDMPTIYDVLTYKEPIPIREAIQSTYFVGLDVVPASMDIIDFEHQTAVAFRDGYTGAPFHSRMSVALDQVKDDYDIVLFDTPPQLSFSVISAIFASTGIVIPLTASMLDVMSLATFMEMSSDLMSVVEEGNQVKNFDFIKFLITRYEGSDSPQLQMASYLRTVLGEAVMANEYVKSTVIGDSGNTKQPVLEVDPRDFNKKTYDRLLESIWGIVGEIETDLRKAWGRPDGS